MYLLNRNRLNICLSESEKFLGFIVNHGGIEANPTKIKALIKIKSLRNMKEVQ